MRLRVLPYKCELKDLVLSNICLEGANPKIQSKSSDGNNFSKEQGRSGGGQVVSMLAFYSDNPSSNPTEAYSLYCKICVWKDLK